MGYAEYTQGKDGTQASLSKGIATKGVHGIATKGLQSLPYSQLDTYATFQSKGYFSPD